MTAAPLKVRGAWKFELTTFQDARGTLREWYTSVSLREHAGNSMHVMQANVSTSQKGALRGISYAATPPGQAKYVTCIRGAILDVVVDLRVGSPTFGSWHMEPLYEEKPISLYIPEGIGHSFLSLVDGSTVLYLLSTAHNPQDEHAVHPLDPDLGISWPRGNEFIMSQKDSSAPSLRAAERQGILPAYTM